MHPVKLGAVYKALLGLGICDDAADEWIAQPNLLLGGDSPIERCASGDNSAVLAVIRGMGPARLTA